MYKLAGLLLVILALVLIVYQIIPNAVLTHVLPTGVFQQISQQRESPATPTLTPYPLPNLLPTILIIPRLKISTQIEHVGTTDTGAMEVPSDASEVGWYRGSAKPGQWGDAVISGHFDTPSGKQAVFYSLSKLAKGDEIRVLSEQGIENTFVVTGVDSLPYTKFPREFVFNSNTGVNLNLITCDGVWNPMEKNYSKRLVVYSTLKL